MQIQPRTVASLAGGAITLLVAWPMLAGPFTPQPKPPGRFGWSAWHVDAEKRQV